MCFPLGTDDTDFHGEFLEKQCLSVPNNPAIHNDAYHACHYSQQKHSVIVKRI